ncbi:hypothetical protein [Vibrio galatheae]|nr:hypothetical protein [Vibrio galatheae]
MARRLNRFAKINHDPLCYFVFVAPYQYEVFEENTLTGMTFWQLSNRFILLPDDAEEHVLEHEFGHLMHATHPAQVSNVSPLKIQ